MSWLNWQSISERMGILNLIVGGHTMTEKPLGLKPLDYHVDFTNCFEPIINLDIPTKQEEYLKKKIIEALKDTPPKKTGALMMTPDNVKIETIKSFENEEISFKCELKDEVGFKREEEHD